LDNSYRPLTVCTSTKCKDNKVSGKLTFLPGFSKFKTYQ
jgi:DNA replication licensing factor MCM7